MYRGYAEIATLKILCLVPYNSLIVAILQEFLRLFRLWFGISVISCSVIGDSWF